MNLILEQRIEKLFSFYFGQNFFFPFLQKTGLTSLLNIESSHSGLINLKCFELQTVAVGEALLHLRPQWPCPLRVQGPPPRSRQKARQSIQPRTNLQSVHSRQWRFVRCVGNRDRNVRRTRREKTGAQVDSNIKQI